MILNELKEKRPPFNARTIALVAIMTATIEVAKLVLAVLPNIEVVTLLCALYGYVFGWYGVLAAGLFVCLEPMIWPIGTWVATYFIYWPLVAMVFMLLSRAKIKGRLPLTATALGLTIFFGVLSSAIDATVYGFTVSYFKNFVLNYIRGIPFYFNHIICNAAVFPTLFPFLAKKLGEIKTRFFTH